MTGTTRRGLIALGAGAAAAAATAGCARTAERDSAGAAPAARPDARVRVPAHGAEQAGITRPALPQRQLVSVVYDVRATPAPLLRDLGELIATMTTTSLDGVVEPGDLTVTVGVGPHLVRTVGRGLPGAEQLPEFPGEEVAESDRGGDLWVQVCAGDALVTALAAERIDERLAGRVRRRWRQRAWRGAYEPTPDGAEAVRNLMGFADGIVNPRTPESLREGVWLSAPAALAGGTIAVLRRFRMDLPGWRDLGVHGQERAVGRRRDSSLALSGGPDVELGAKTPDGRYKIPVDAHVRRANPLDLGLPMMLRRSYSVDDPDPGLLFVCFQSSLRTFTATMRRLVESDEMISYTTTTATGTFLVLPGASASRPLGSTLFE